MNDNVLESKAPYNVNRDSIGGTPWWHSFIVLLQTESLMVPSELTDQDTKDRCRRHHSCSAGELNGEDLDGDDLNGYFSFFLFWEVGCFGRAVSRLGFPV